MWLFQAYRAHEVAAQWQREADEYRLAARRAHPDRPGVVRRSLARAFAASSRSIEAMARRLDAASFDPRREPTGLEERCV